MSILSPRRWRRSALASCLGAAIAAGAIADAQPAADPAAAGLHDYLAVCRADRGALWGQSLCGPLVVVDSVTRQGLATEQPPGAGFRPVGELWRGSVPARLGSANTAVVWAGERWAMALLPVPADRFDRVRLLLHEAFHRIQPALGLDGRDPANPHLDERDGRYWLRLELRALATALRQHGPARAAATRDAVVFRRMRYARYPEAAVLEDALERKEGLAEYTAVHLALEFLHLPVARAADDLASFEDRPTFVRSLGYATGPALGLLLDDADPAWRRDVAQRGFAAQLARAIGFVAPADLPRAAAEAQSRYDAASLARAEDDRAARHASERAVLRARLIDGPVLTLRQTGLSTSFDPNRLIAMGDDGTVYPAGRFTAEWGTLELERGGALIAPDLHSLRVAAPGPAGSQAGTVHGDGWILELAAGWHLTPGPRHGDVEVARTPVRPVPQRGSRPPDRLP